MFTETPSSRTPPAPRSSTRPAEGHHGRDGIGAFWDLVDRAGQAVPLHGPRLLRQRAVLRQRRDVHDRVPGRHGRRDRARRHLPGGGRTAASGHARALGGRPHDLVDTPGADSINARHTDVAFDYIRNADAILFVTYYNHAFAKSRS